MKICLRDFLHGRIPRHKCRINHLMRDITSSTLILILEPIAQQNTFSHSFSRFILFLHLVVCVFNSSARRRSSSSPSPWAAALLHPPWRRRTRSVASLVGCPLCLCPCCSSSCSSSTVFHLTISDSLRRSLSLHFCRTTRTCLTSWRTSRRPPRLKRSYGPVRTRQSETRKIRGGAVLHRRLLARGLTRGALASRQTFL